MKRKSFREFATLALLGLVLYGSQRTAFAQSYRPQVGQRHPLVTLPRIDTGEPVSLSDYRGKKVLLIHFASW